MSQPTALHPEMPRVTEAPHLSGGPGTGTIDVIIPCYKYGHLLGECVDSVLRQGVPDLRILIIDDASPDDTAAVAATLAAQDSRITVHRHITNLGHIATYNEGLAWASARYTLLLSADDLLLPGSLSRAIDLLDANPEIGFVYGPAIEVPTGKPIPVCPPQSGLAGATTMSGAEFFRANRFANIVPTCTAVVRTEAQKQLGGYRSELPHAGDMEMWLRFAARGLVARVHAYQGIYRRHTHNMSNAYIADNLLDLQQRKAVLDFVFDSNRPWLKDVEVLREVMYSGLALSAVASASQPFLRADLEQFDAVLAFAAGLDPNVRHSFAWRFQKVKRFLGPRLWARLGPLRNFAHSLVSGARGLVTEGPP